jgi:anti-anti-sigma factor
MTINQPQVFSAHIYETSPQIKVIRCAGEIDAGSCAKLIDALDRVTGPGTTCVTVDLSSVTFIDSTGIGCLIHGCLRCRKLGAAFDIVPGDAMRHIMRTGRLGNALPLVEGGHRL